MSRATNVKMPYGFKQKLKCDLSSIDSVLQLKDENAQHALCGMLGRDCYTHLVLSNCVLHEIVRVECINGELIMARARECTTPMKFYAGDSVCFEVTPELCKAAVLQDTDGEETVQGFKSESLDISPDPDDPTRVCIELKEKDPIEFCTPGYKFTFENGCLTQEADATTAIKDGTVYNPTICFKDNKIVDIESGSSLDFSAPCGSCGGCGCSNCGTTETTTDVQ